MSRWKIYSKDGSVLHESIEKYDGKGRVVEQDTLEYSGKWMGDCFITVSFKSAYPIDFQIGDYIIYRGEKFTINYDPTVVKKSSRGTYGEGFVYDSVKFNALSNELTDVKFHDWVLSDNHVHYSSLPNFSFYAKDMNDLADRLQACMDRWCKDNGFAKEDYWIFYTPGSAGDTNPYDRTITRAKDISTDETFIANVLTRWKSIYGDGGTLVERADELIDKNVQISNQTVWQGMALFKSDFGLNFIIRGREVIVGAAGTIASHIFKYGKGNGLYEVEKQADTDQKVVTRLHAYGSSDNLPTRYYAELDMKVFANVTSVEKGKDFFRIGLDMDYKPGMFTQKMSKYGDDIFAIKITLGETEINARIEGHDDKNKARIYSEYLSTSTDPDDNTDKEVYDAFYNALAEGSKIYITGGVNKDLAPAGHIDYAANKLPDNMAINNLMLPGFPKYALSDLCKSEYDKSSDTTNYYIRKDKDSTDYVKFHSEAGNHVVRFSSEQYDPYIVSANADKLGYKDDDIFCTEENDDNGLKKVYPSVEEVTEAEAGVSTDDKTYINTIVSADIIKDNGVYPKKTGTSIPGFKVVIKNLGFDLQDAIAAAGGESCKLSMKDGHCGGRDFDVPSVSKNSDGTWTLNCKRSPDNSLDLYYPYSYNMSIGGTASADEAYQIRKGDHFVLTGIAMEATNYVWAASVKLLRKAIHWLCKNDYSRYTYTPKIDEIYMARQDQEAQKSEGKVKSLHDTIKEGDLLWFQDDDLLLDGKVYIDQLVIKENGNNGIPTYDVTLRNEVQVGTIQRIQNKVDSIANDVKSGNVGGSMSASNVENIVNAVGDGRYLRKDQDDSTNHKLGVGALDINGGDLTIMDGTSSFGITKEGIAKLAGAVADYLKSSDFSKGTGVGFDGKGYGITKDAAGKYTLEIDNLVARMKMIVAELEVHEMTFIGGTVVMSSCGNRIAVVEALDGNGNVIATANSESPTLTIPDGNVADKFRCYFLASDGDRQIKNEWTVGQLARCKTNNIAKPGDYSNYENREYWRLVVAVSDAPVTIEGKSYHYIDLSNSTSKNIYLTDKAGTARLVTLGGVCESMASLPYAGDNVIGLGHCWDDKRQNVAILSVLSLGWTLYKGISAYDLPKENIVNKFGIDETIVTTDHFILRPYAAPKETQTVAVVRGAYDDKANYGHNDMVTLGGQTWIGSGIEIGETITGQKPAIDSPYWVLAASKGIQGPKGEKGDTGEKGDKGDKGDGYAITFLLNGVPAEVLNFDTIKSMEGSEVSLEADFYNNGESYNAANGTITCYDAEGNVLGSPIEVSKSDSVVADGGNLYLSKNCKYIVAEALDANKKSIFSKSIGVVRNGESVGVKSVTYKVIKNVDANDSLNWDDHTAQPAFPTDKPDKGKYMYVMTIVTYTDGSVTNSVSSSYTPTDGIGVTTTTTVTYARTTNNVQPSSFPLTSVPTDLKLGEYLWSKTVVTYKGVNTEATTSIAVSRVGKDGDKGYSLHMLYSNVEKPGTDVSHISTSMQAGYDYIYVYSDQSTDDDVSKGVGQTFKKIKGDGYAISFLLNGVPVDVINFDTVKRLSNVASFEADLTNDGAACNANRATLTCYDAEGSVLGSPIDVTDTSAIVADGGNLYLSKDCKNITAQFYGENNVLLKGKSVAVLRDTQMYALKQLNTTRATVKPSNSTTSATFTLDAELHFQVVKNTGGNTENPVIISIKATAGGETFSNSAVNNTEATLTCKGTTPYDANNRPPSTMQVEVVCEGKTLFATVPVTMEAGVAIDINNNIGQMSVTVKGQGDTISQLQSDGKSISAKVSGMKDSLSATGIDIDKHTVAFTGSQFLWQNNSGVKVAYLDDNGNAVFSGTVYASNGSFTGTIAATCGNIGAWTIKDGGLTAEYGSKACIDMRDSKSSFRLDSDKTTNGGSLLDIYNSSGRVISIVSEDSDEAALYIRSNASNRNLAISTFGNNSFLARADEATTINRFAYACVRTGDVNVDFDKLFVSKETSWNKFPGNMIVTTNETTDQTVKLPANPALGVHLLVIQGTNRWVYFNGNGHEFIRGREHSSTANSKTEGQWNYFIWDGSYWRCIFLNSGNMW